MNRRNLLKTLGISAVGLATVPIWMDSWTTEKLPPIGFNVSENQKLILSQLVGTIIPTTNIPGAKELEVNKFILTMMSDCFEKDMQDEFLAGLDELDKAAKKEYGTSFMKISDAQQLELLHAMEIAPSSVGKKQNFVSMVKNLTITGYMSSEYVLKNILHYELVPGRFNGSFPIDQSIYKNA